MATYNSIKQASDAYFAAKKRGDAAGMKEANNAANAIRKSQGQQAQYATSDINSVAKKNSSSGISGAGSGSSGSSASDALKGAVSSGMNGTSGGSASGGSGFLGSATNVGTWSDSQNAIREKMNANSQEWHTATPERKKQLEADNKALANRLGGTVSFNPNTGSWSGTADEPLQLPQMDIPGYDEWLSQSGYNAALDSLQKQNESYLKQLEEATAAQANQINQGYDDAARQAYISYMQGRRTLPQRLSGSGVNGGLADSQEIALDAELQNNQTTLNGQRQSALQQMQSALQQNKLAAQNNYLGQLSGLQQNAASGYQNYYENNVDRILNNFYTQQELANQTEQQKWERAYALLQTMGYADSQIAAVLGVAPGTVTNDAEYRANQTNLDLQRMLRGL